MSYKEEGTGRAGNLNLGFSLSPLDKVGLVYMACGGMGVSCEIL